MPTTDSDATRLQIEIGEAIVRPWQAEDADALLDAVECSRAELGRWLPWATPAYARADAVAWIAFCERSWQERSAYPFGVFAPDGVAIGGVGINRIEAPNRCGALGYWIATPQTGRGIARRAARAVVQFGFARVGLCRIEILILPDNGASRRVAESLGAQWECDARARVQHAGRPATACVYALLPEDLR